MVNLTLQLSMLHAASYHWIQTYSGGFEKIKEDFALFFHNDGWISHGHPAIADNDCAVAWPGPWMAHYRTEGWCHRAAAAPRFPS